jgi:hypothetical protein
MTNEAFIRSEIQMVTEKPVHQKMINSPKFPTPVPSFSTIQISCDVPCPVSIEKETLKEEKET